MARSPSLARGRPQLLRLFAIRNVQPPGFVYENWQDAAPAWPAQQGVGNAVKLTQGEGPDVTSEESRDELWIRTQAWADEPADLVNANQVAATWMTEKGKSMQLLTGFMCVSILSVVVFVILQHCYDVFNCDYLFIGNVPFCNMVRVTY